MCEIIAEYKTPETEDAGVRKFINEQIVTLRSICQTDYEIDAY